jgi:hypothetical protein
MYMDINYIISARIPIVNRLKGEAIPVTGREVP